MSISQSERVARIQTQLPDDELVLSRFSGHERLSTLFEYQVDCISENASLELYEVLGLAVTLEVDLESGEQRYINGIVSHASHAGSQGEYALYSLTLRPQLWLLSHTSDHRIFQEINVPDIIESVLDEAGLRFNNLLQGAYPNWNYCVQYGESNFDFISRLMEHEGIYYYFTHSQGEHIMVLCDNQSAHDTVSDYQSIPHYPADMDVIRDQEHLVSWRLERQVTTGKFALNDFGFDQPKRDLLVTAENANSGKYPKFERYEYPGAYPNNSSGALVRSYGEQLARQHLEQQESSHELASAHGNVRGLSAGNLFSLVNCERTDQNREYLIVDANCSLDMDNYYSGGIADQPVEFKAAFICMNSQKAFRAPRVTPKPRIQGPQTAIVVGPAGEEIWTDEHGRVKLQFHWDRNGRADETSSSWVRVSQVWAGEGWGAIHIPRIGHEVIVEFIDGDPDRPIVTGRVYNGDRPVPYDLPGNATQSGIKSRSSKNGVPKNFNEIRMEDKKGEEELYFHAEKDQTSVVENDRAEVIGHDHVEKIGRNCSESIGNNRMIDVSANHTETIGASMSLTVGNSKTETVGVNSAETVKVAKEISVGAGFLISVGGAMSVSVGGDRSESVGNNRTVDVSDNNVLTAGGHESITVGKSRSLEITEDQEVKIGGKSVTNVSDEAVINAKKIQLVAKDEISLKVGSAQIVMKKNGDITIKGKKINVKGSGDVVIKGSKIKGN